MQRAYINIVYKYVIKKKNQMPTATTVPNTIEVGTECQQ